MLVGSYHTVVEDVVAEFEVLMPDCIGAKSAVHMMISVPMGNMRILRQDLEPTQWDRELGRSNGGKVEEGDDGRWGERSKASL
jgi:hypothetical protein